MTARDFFRRPDGSVRPVWRVAVFLLVSATAYATLELLIAPLLAGSTAAVAGAQLIAAQWAMLAALVVGHAVTFATVDRRGWSFVGLGREDLRPSSLALGAALGTIAVGVPTAGLLAAGWLRADAAVPGSWLLSATLLAAALVPAAMAEEMLLRGYVFAVLREAWGAWWTLLVTSVVFAALHYANPGVTLRSLIVVALAGVFLGGVLLVTGSLYAAIAAHVAWNWVLAAVFHAPVSGTPFAAPGYRVVDAGPDWATGGAWGPEGGLGAAAGLGLGIAYLFARRARREERLG